MSGFLGLDPATANAKANALSPMLGTLDHLVSELAATRRASLSPASHGVEKGDKTIAPWSVADIASAAQDLATARRSADELIARLRGEVAAQDTASGNGNTLATLGAPTMGNSTSTRDPLVGAEARTPAGLLALWKSLTEAQKQELITRLPGAIGNLDGIPYHYRDEANRIVLADELDRLTSLETESLDVLANGDVRGYDYLAFFLEHGYDSPGEFRDELAAAKAVDETLDSAGTTTYQLIQFQKGPPALAAVSVGDLDTASQVTVNVPGMATTVKDSMRDWTGGALNLYNEQTDANALYGGEDAVAVVSWIGYDTPRPATEGYLDVLSSSRAEVGAENLTSFLENVSDVRGWKPGENLSVFAHSYGTTTASLALKNTPVENFTMAGSAGLNTSIPTVDALQVHTGNVWATEANGDNIADMGRGWGFGVEVFGKPVYNNWTPTEHPVNPTEGLFGGNTFSSEDSGDLHGSDWHSATPRVSAELSGEPAGDYGYLDRNTTPLYNIALTTLGFATTDNLAK